MGEFGSTFIKMLLYSLHVPKLDIGATFALPRVGPQLEPREHSAFAVGLFNIGRMNCSFADVFSVKCVSSPGLNNCNLIVAVSHSEAKVEPLDLKMMTSLPTAESKRTVKADNGDDSWLDGAAFKRQNDVNPRISIDPSFDLLDDKVVQTSMLVSTARPPTAPIHLTSASPALPNG